MRSETRRLDHLDDEVLETATVRFDSPRRSLRGWGEALRIEVPAPWVDHVDVVQRALASIDIDDPIGQPASGPVAFAALPFDRSAVGSFVVPAVIVGSTPDGDRWTSIIDGGVIPEKCSSPAPQRVELTAEMDPELWCDTVAEATKRIASGKLTKAVLARHLTAIADVDFDPVAIAVRLAQSHPQALRFCIDGFVGASPELLVSRFNDVVRAHPMAGTTPRSGDPARDHQQAAELLASSKNRAEHQITIDFVVDALLAFCSYLDSEPEPSVVPAGSVQHLATMVEGRLSHPAPSALDLVVALHPTPAVGGWPRAEALALIAQLEPVGRGRYAGPVGWVDSFGNGAWAVGIRSAAISGRVADIWAGVGVVADSDPLNELAETRAKFAATLGAFTML